MELFPEQGTEKTDSNGAVMDPMVPFLDPLLLVKLPQLLGALWALQLGALRALRLAAPSRIASAGE